MKLAYKIGKVHKRYWWPHPYAREARLLWVKTVAGYRYFVNGIETDITGKPIRRES